MPTASAAALPQGGLPLCRCPAGAGRPLKLCDARHPACWALQGAAPAPPEPAPADALGWLAALFDDQDENPPPAHPTRSPSDGP